MRRKWKRFLDVWWTSHDNDWEAPVLKNPMFWFGISMTTMAAIVVWNVFIKPLL